MGLTEEIVKNVKDESLNKKTSSESMSTDADYEKEIQEAVKRQVEPIVEKAILPLIAEVEELKLAVDTINKNIAPSITAVGNSPAASGAAGAGAYSSTQGSVEGKIASITANLDRIKKGKS